MIAIFKYREKSASIAVDGQVRDLELFNLNLGIGKYAGGGMNLCPHAKFNGGKLAVTLVKKISRTRIIMNLHKLFAGNLESIEEVEMSSVKEISIRSEEKLKVQVDGEMLSASKHFNIQLKQNVFRVFSKAG